MTNETQQLIGSVDIPFHGLDGKSAYEIACDLGFIGTEKEWLESLDPNRMFSSCLKMGYTWYIDTDAVKDFSGASYGTLRKCMTDEFTGTCFYVRTASSEAGSAAYPSSYSIDGANGYLSLRDCIIWTGRRLVHIPAFEAKSSVLKNADGLYSPKSGVDGLMSSVDKAYLTDLINEYWGKTKLPVYPDPNPAEGWQTNWLFDTGWYLGGIKKNCGGHPPVLNDNHTSWAVLVLNGMNTDADNINHNHRVEIAFDLVNSKCYMRRGWMSANTWADWTEIGAIADGAVISSKIANGAVSSAKIANGSVTDDKLSVGLKAKISETEVLKSQQGGISFSIGENGILTISKED